MKLLHVADLHIGDSRTLPNYLDRQRRMLDWIRRQAIEHDVDVLLVAGDVFDSKYVTARERDMFLEWLLHNDHDGEDNNYYTVMMSGNHDVIEAGYTHLHGLRMLVTHNALHTTSVIDSAQLLNFSTLYLAVLPYANYKGDELSTVVRSMRKSLDLKLEKIRPDIAQKIKSPYFVVMAHEAIAGALNEAGTYKARGPSIDTTLNVIYWALGDIHKPFQSVAPNAWYPGSPIQHDFGDISQTRGALLVDLDDPTNPTPLLIGSEVTPLITLYDIPEDWPTDAIVRYEGTPDEIAAQHFPENVIAFKPVVAPSQLQDAIDLDGYGMLDGIEEVMDGLVPDDYQGSVVTYLKQAVDLL